MSRMRYDGSFTVVSIISFMSSILIGLHCLLTRLFLLREVTGCKPFLRRLNDLGDMIGDEECKQHVCNISSYSSFRSSSNQHLHTDNHKWNPNLKSKLIAILGGGNIGKDNG
jgi:hypothetical protein